MKLNFTEKEIKTIILHMKGHPTSMMVGENKLKCQCNRFIFHYIENLKNRCSISCRHQWKQAL